MTEGINNNAYSGAAITEQNKIVRASLDTDGTVGDVKQAEAQSKLSGSVFDASAAQTQSDAKIQESINANARLNGKTGALDVVKKYLGAANIFSNISFKTITGVSQELSGDAGWTNQVKAELDAKVEQNIQQQIQNAGQIAEQFTSRISQAIKQAENELCGDADALSSNDLAKGKESKDVRKTTIESLTYNDSQGNISTYDGATKGELSRGYEATKQYLENNGAKSFTREVDGEQKTIYKLKDGRHAIIDDAGQLHFLQTTTTIGKNTYTTFDVETITTKLPEGSKDVEIKRRRVDNEYRTVVRYTDSDGNKCARYVDYNEQTNEYVLSDDLTHVSAGGRAKYTTETSALSARAGKEDDPVEFVNGQVKNGTYVDNQGEVRDNIMMTRRSRAKLETPDAVKSAVTNLTAQIEIGSKGTVVESGGQFTITLNNGHSYNIDPNNPSEANRQMNFVAQELKNIGTPQTSETVALGYTWSGDTRVDANSPGEVHDGAHGHTSGVQRGVVRGNDGAFVRRSNSGHVHSLSGHLGSDKGLTAQQFRDEGWKTDANRTSESAIIAIMDKTAEDSGQIPTRLLGTATQFAERFVAAYKKQNPNINIDNIDYTKLGKAIAAANPSLFDGDGNMYKNVDFQRLNLPKRLNPENYRKA